MADGKMKEISRRTLTIMKTEKPYLETELNLQNLSEKMNLPPYQVSQVINEKLKKKFL